MAKLRAGENSFIREFDKRVRSTGDTTNVESAGNRYVSHVRSHTVYTCIVVFRSCIYVGMIFSDVEGCRVRRSESFRPFDQARGR
jgi:hypothetical protein